MATFPGAPCEKTEAAVPARAMKIASAITTERLTMDLLQIDRWSDGETAAIGVPGPTVRESARSARLAGTPARSAGVPRRRAQSVGITLATSPRWGRDRARQ